MEGHYFRTGKSYRDRVCVRPVEHEQHLRRDGDRPAGDPGREALGLGRDVVLDGDAARGDAALCRRVAAGGRARRGADVLLLGTPQGVKKFERYLCAMEKT